MDEIRRPKQQHTCKKCGAVALEDGSNFPSRLVDGKRYFRHLCRQCFNQYTRDHQNKSGARRRKHNQRRDRDRRNHGVRSLLHDCKGYDRRHGLQYDLDLPFVEGLIAEGCRYCGASNKQIRIGLDRIDNATGHIRLNVVPCCTRCNLIRGGMPYVAWLTVAEAVRKVFQAGLFGGWVPGNKFGT